MCVNFGVFKFTSDEYREDEGLTDHGLTAEHSVCITIHGSNGK